MPALAAEPMLDPAGCAGPAAWPGAVARPGVVAWPGAARTIIRQAIAIITIPAAPVRYAPLACSRLTTAVISATPFRLIRPLFPVLL